MGKLRKACANCIKYKLACEAKRPCSRCVLHQCSCIDVERKPRAARKPKRPRTSIDGIDVDVCPSHLPSALPSAAATSSSSPSTKPPASMPYIPELVLNDNEPLFSSNLDANSFMMQSTEASLLPYNDLGYMTNNSFLSSVLMLDHDQASLGAPLLPKVEPSQSFGADDMARKVEYGKSLQDATFLNSSFLQGANLTAAAPTKAAAPNATSTAPHPLVVLNKNEWTILDCNVEFAQFLGYASVAEFHANVDLLNHAITPEAIGLSKQVIQSPLPTHFDRLATLKSKNGTERSVTLRVEVMDKLVTFTVKDVFEMRPMCFYTRWLKAVAPNAITPCDRVRCQCRLFDYMSTMQSQMLQPLQHLQQQPQPQPSQLLSLSQSLSL